MSRGKLRGQFDEDVFAEIKRVGLAQLVAGGPGAVSVNGVARELGVSGPALYRYVRGRDELITALILDAYVDLNEAIRAATTARRTAHTKLAAFVRAYRNWADTHPHHYRLLFRAPLPGYDPNTDALVRAAHPMMIELIETLPDPGGPGRSDVRAWLQARDMSERQAPAAAAAVALWAAVHGLVSLEIEGDFASMGLDPDQVWADALAGYGLRAVDVRIRRPESPL